MRSTVPIQFVREDKIDYEVYDESTTVKFANKQEEDRYVALDTELIERIKQVFESFGVREGKDVHHIEDWWPNHLRGVECDPSHFRADLLGQLQALLTGEFASWRIIIHFYRGLSGSADCGSSLLLSDRILAATGLKKYLNKG